MKQASKEKEGTRPKDMLGEIPDYQFLFEKETSKKGKSKSKFFKKLIKINAWQLILYVLVYLIANLPVWATPICTANIINVATEAVASGNINQAMWTEIIINGSIMGALIILNVPATMWRWQISSKMLRRTSAVLKSSVIRKLQSLSITYH